MAGETETVGGAAAPSAALRDEILRVLGAERCPAFYAQRGEPCDGMEGCARCLGAVADVVLEVVSEHVAALAASDPGTTLTREDRATLQQAIELLQEFGADGVARALGAMVARLAASGPGAAQTDYCPGCKELTASAYHRDYCPLRGPGAAAPPTLTDEDTKRLDWLEDNMAFLEPLDGAREWVVDYHGGRYLGPSLRAAIDSAIAASLQAEGKAMCQACYYGSTRDKGICSVCEGTGVVPASSASRRAVEACDNPFGRDAARRRVRAP